MQRNIAKQAHSLANLSFWAESSDWDSGNAVIEFGRRSLQALPFSLHSLTRRLLFDDERVIAVNGESVVALNGLDKVDKFMLRYPRRMDTSTFRERVDQEVTSVVSHLTGIALPTTVGIKEADILKLPGLRVPAVVQTQPKLDLNIHLPLHLVTVLEEKGSPLKDKTAQDLELMLSGVDQLASKLGFYPDIAHSSGNLRRSTNDGAVTLIDVMPIYADGSRLIGDYTFKPPHSWPEFADYRAFVGQYGS